MYIICCDLKSGFTDIQDVSNAISKIGDVIQILDSSWVLNTKKSCDDIYAELKKTISDDRFIVAQMYDGNRQGWLAKSMWEWMRQKNPEVVYNYQLAYDRLNETSDTKKLLGDIVVLLRDKLSVEQKNVCRPNQTTLLFYSPISDKEVMKVIEKELKDKAYYSLTHFIPSNDTSGFVMNPNATLSQSLIDLWGGTGCNG